MDSSIPHHVSKEGSSAANTWVVSEFPLQWKDEESFIVFVEKCKDTFEAAGYHNATKTAVVVTHRKMDLGNVKKLTQRVFGGDSQVDSMDHFHAEKMGIISKYKLPEPPVIMYQLEKEMLESAKESEQDPQELALINNRLTHAVFKAVFTWCTPMPENIELYMKSKMSPARQLQWLLWRAESQGQPFLKDNAEFPRFLAYFHDISMVADANNMKPRALKAWKEFSGLDYPWKEQRKEVKHALLAVCSGAAVKRCPVCTVPMAHTSTAKACSDDCIWKLCGRCDGPRLLEKPMLESPYAYDPRGTPIDIDYKMECGRAFHFWKIAHQKFRRAKIWHDCNGRSPPRVCPFNTCPIWMGGTCDPCRAHDHKYSYSGVDFSLFSTYPHPDSLQPEVEKLDYELKKLEAFKVYKEFWRCPKCRPYTDDEELAIEVEEILQKRRRDALEHHPEAKRRRLQ